MSRRPPSAPDADRGPDRRRDGTLSPGERPQDGSEVETEPTEAAPSDARPPRVCQAQTDVRQRLRQARRLLVCLDFDGTLAHIADDRDAPEPTPANRQALADLVTRDDVDIAVVSGRALDDVRSRVGIDAIDYAGNHGLELLVDGERSTHPLAAARLPALRRVRDELESRLAPLDGCEVEDKRLTLTIHTRLATPADAALARKRTQTVVDAVAGDDIRIEPGKQVLELLPAIPTGKDLAVRLLRATTHDALPVYVGDDTADEAAFRAVAPEGVSIHVGDGVDTDADYRLDGPTDVAAFLQWLDRERDRP